MAKYEFNGTTFEAPDGMSEQDVVKAVMADAQKSPPPSNGEVTPAAQPAAAPATAPVEPAAPTGETLEDSLTKKVSADGKLDADDLQFNKDWIGAARSLWEERHPGQPVPPDADLSNKALWTMSMMDNNLVSGSLDAARIKFASDKEKAALLHLMETYENVGYSMKGFGRALAAVGTDPSTYVGLGTFGIGTAASAGTKIATRSALKSMLRTGMKTAVEGAMLGAASDTVKQTTEIEVGKEKEFSTGRVLASAGIGAVAGGVLGAGAEGVAAKIAARRKAPELIPQVTPGEVTPRSEATPTAGEAPKAAEAASTPATNDVAEVAAKDAAERSAEHPGETPVTLDEQVIPAATEAVPAVEKPVEAPVVDPATTPANAVLKEVPVASPEGAKSVMEAIKAASEDSGARLFPTTRTGVTQAASPAIDILSKIRPDEMPEVVEQLRREAVTTEQQLLLHSTFKDAHEQFLEKSSNLYREIAATDDPAEKAALQQQFQAVTKVRENIAAGDLALSSADGRGLGNRVGAYLTGKRRDISVDSILKDKFGVEPKTATPEQLDGAHAEYFKQYEMWKKIVATNDEVLKVDKQLQEAYDKGQHADYSKLTDERNALIEALRQEEMSNRGVLDAAYRGFNGFLKYNNELVISQVFTTSTLVVNTIPSLIRTVYQPALDAGMKGFDLAARRKMTSTYMAMAQSTPTALRAAIAAFDVERGLLASDTSRLLETETAFRGRGGRMLRTFPRFLQATDEFFSQVNYRGFVIGNATSNAVEAGLRLNLKGEALDKFVTQHVSDMAEHMFSADINAANVIPHLRQVALDKGLRGESVNVWIKTQLDKNGDLYRTAYNESGKNYADDLLFKRKFSGTNNASKAAALYEKFTNDNPWMKLTGQLFFRTPVRVFEEGIKLTPGLNLLSPRMLSNLTGKNGPAAKAKAEGYMFVSYAIGTWAMSQYAKGNLTSGGPTAYKVRRGRENAGDYQPYSVRVGNQSFSFRNLDPFGTPLKIIANVMDRFNDLEYRKSRGEFVEDKYKEAMSWLSVSVGSIASAISDANLTDGLAEILKLGEAMVDPEKHDATFSRFLFGKAKLYVPNQINKVAQQFDPSIADPVTFYQTMMARINPGSSEVSRQYDVLGQPRQLAAPSGLLLGLQLASNDQLKRGKSDKDLAVIKAVNDLEIANDSGFGVFPVKAPAEYGMAGQDLRGVYTSKGVTYYDRLNQLYAGLGVKDQLYAQLVENKEGSVKQRTDMAKDTINNARDIAFVMLMSEESGLQQSSLKAIMDENDILSGKRDVPSLPYR